MATLSPTVSGSFQLRPDENLALGCFILTLMNLSHYHRRIMCVCWCHYFIKLNINFYLTGQLRLRMEFILRIHEMVLLVLLWLLGLSRYTVPGRSLAQIYWLRATLLDYIWYNIRINGDLTIAIVKLVCICLWCSAGTNYHCHNTDSLLTWDQFSTCH